MHFNERHFSRIFPRGSRVDSSNFSPVPFWMVGCQMVSLNFQTHDSHMHLNTSLFLDNGSCGYILKPPLMCDILVPFDPDNYIPSAYEWYEFGIICGEQVCCPAFLCYGFGLSYSFLFISQLEALDSKQSLLRKSSDLMYFFVLTVNGCACDEVLLGFILIGTLLIHSRLSTSQSTRLPRHSVECIGMSASRYRLVFQVL